MKFGFSYVGLIWYVLLLIPNLIWTKHKPKDYEEYVVKENKILLALERTGQFIITPVAIFFSDFNLFLSWASFFNTVFKFESKTSFTCS